MIPLRDNIKTRTFAVINYFLLAVNIAVFFFQVKLSNSNHLEKFLFDYSFIPNSFIKNPIDNFYRLISSQFIHGGLAHLIGNMVFLYIFGDNVEDKFGHVKYLLFYIGAGIAATCMQMFFTTNSNVPMLGASGAIAGVLGAYIFYYPKARITTLIPFGFFSRIIEIPAFFFLGVWFIIQTFSGASSISVSHAVRKDLGGIAWWAHIGGFSFGLIGSFLTNLCNVPHETLG